MGGFIHLRGDTREIFVPVHGKTTVNKGDLMVVASDASCLVGATADFYGYPAYPLCKSNTAGYFRDHFVGIAMKGKVAGVTNDIPVATAGIFRGTIVTIAAGTSQACKVGSFVYGVSVAAGASLSATTCRVSPSTISVDSNIGRCIRHVNAATAVDFMLLTRISGVSGV